MEASIEQAFEDGWAEITRGLNMNVSAFFMLCTQQTEGWLLTPARATFVIVVAILAGWVRCRLDRVPGLLEVAVLVVRS